jgi:prepilin-type N-terminal cleavage/methylation domain-containing protein
LATGVELLVSVELHVRDTEGHTGVANSREPRGQGGFTLIEVMIAISLFAIMAVTFAGTAGASYRAYQNARARTAAEETATAELEDARRLPYDQLGTVGGNPPGTIAPTQTVTVGGFTTNLAIRVVYVDDPIPGGFQTAANYKSVRVTATWQGKQLAQIESRVAPPREPSRDKGVVKVRVVDYALNQPVSGATVQLSGSPAGNRIDTTDASGQVVFAAVDPNTATAPYDYSTVSVTVLGYDVLPEDTSPNPAVRFQLTAGQLFTTVVRVYRAATLDIKLVDSAGLPFVGPANVEVSSSRGRATIPVVGGATIVSTVGTEKVISGVQYTVGATATGFASPAVTQVVPTAYPTDLVSRYVFTMAPATFAPLQVLVRDATTLTALSGVNVIALDGPIDTQVGCVTASNGKCTMNVPAGATPNYTVRALSFNGRPANEVSVSVPGPATTNATIGLAAAP